MTAAAVILLSAFLAACGGGASPDEVAGSANRAPLAFEDTAVQDGGALNIAVLANDRDPDGDALTLASVTMPGNGTASIDGNGTADGSDDFVVYTPTGGYGGNDSFSYTINDSFGLTASATVTIRATSTAPVATSDDASTAADTPVSIFVLANDSDPQGLPLQLVSVTAAANGVAVINDNATPGDASDDFVVYGPNGGFSGSDSFSYTISNGAESASALVNVLVGGSGSAGVSGDVTKGPILGATIKLYRIDGKGLPIGSPVAQTLTNAQGKWTVAVPLPREPLLVVSAGGSYRDETDTNPDISLRRIIQLNASDALEGVMPAADDYLALNLYTNAMLLKSRKETVGNEFDQVYASNRSLMTQAIGFDPLTTAPTDPGNPNPGASEAAKQYALLLGGAANVANAIIQRTTQTAVAFNVLSGFINDMQDCRLDGLNQDGNAGYFFLGAQRLMPTDLDLNLEITRFRNNNFARYAGISASIDQSLCSQSGAVPDTVAPVITLAGANPQTFEGGSAYVDPGATAMDDRDGDVSASLGVSGSVDGFTPGGYTLTYSASDGAGNVGTATRSVTVVDTTPPVLTLNGTSPVTVLLGTSYTDSLGASALDAVDGDLTAAIVSVNPVDINTPGSYTITYDVSDSSGNAATQITRVVDVVDTMDPVITLNGNSPLNHEAGTPYVDAGATAFDFPDGDLTASIVTVNNVNSAIVGSYTVTYDVTDSGGNAAATVTRIVNVVDSTAPVITLTGANPQTIEGGDPYSELGATASDSFDGDLTASLVIDATAVDTSTPGSYVVTYDVIDSNGNAAAQVTRTVTVQDTTAPVITLTGANPQTLEAATAYTELGATATDTVDGDLSAAISIDTTAVDPATPGSYLVTYDVTDAAGNAATQVTRTVNVVDTTPPVITLLGNNPEPVDEGQIYSDAGATATDTLDGDLSADIVVVNPVDTAVPGSYVVTYDVSDAAGNAAVQVTRTVNVNPVNDPPVLGAPVPDQTAIEGDFFSIDLSAYFSDPDGDPLTYSISGLPAGTGLTLNPATGVLSGNPNASDAIAAPLALVASASDPEPLSVSDSFMLTITPLVDVDVDIVADDYVPPPGGVVNFTITLHNNSGLPATNIIVTNIEPAELTFGVPTPSAGSWDPGSSTWQLPELAGGASETLIIPATVDAATPLGTVVTNTAEITAQDQLDPDDTNLKSVDLTVQSAGDSYDWLGGDAGGPDSWFIGNNWNPIGVPTINDVVTIPVGAAFYPVLSSDVDIKKLTLDAGAQLDLNGNTLSVRGDVSAAGLVFGAGTVRVLGGTVKGNFSGLEMAGAIDISGTVNVSGDLSLTSGTVHVSAQTINVAGNFTAAGTGVLLMHHGTDELRVMGDVIFSGGDTAAPVDGNAPLRDGTIYVGGDFVQNGDVHAFAAEDKLRVVFNGTGVQTVTMTNPDNSNPDPSVPAASGSRFSILEIEKNGATDGAVVFLTDTAVLLNLNSLPGFTPTLQGTGSTRLVAGGANLQGAEFNNLPLEIVNGGDFGLVSDLVFRNMRPDVVQFAIRRPSFSTPSLNIFDRLDFQSLPDTGAGGAYFELENTELTAPPSLSLTVASSMPRHGEPWSRTIGDFTLTWGAASDDTDGDGVTDAEEFANGLDPRDSDVDDDGLNDGEELYVTATDPVNANTDGDGLDDGVEVDIGSDPNSVTTNLYFLDAVAGNDANGGTSWADAMQSHSGMFGPGGPLEVLNGSASDPVYVLYAPGSYDLLALNGRSFIRLAGSLGPGARRASDIITTVFDGQQAGRVVDFSDSTNIGMRFIRLTNGLLAGGPDASGAGLRLTGASGSSAELKRVEIVENTADRNGGGFFVEAGSLLDISESLVLRNKARGSVGTDWGGGGGSAFGSLNVTDSVIAGNSQFAVLDAEIGGGGLLLRPAVGEQVMIRDSMLFSNTSLGDGGGIFVDQPAGIVRIENILIAGNASLQGAGGGVALGNLAPAADVVLASNTIAYNQVLTRSDAGGGVDISMNSAAGSMRDNIVWFNDDANLGRAGSDNFFDHGGGVLVEFNNLQNDPTGGLNSNIDWDPKFDSGFFIKNGSKSKDAGSTTADAVGLGAPYTTSATGSPDTGLLDHGFHYQQGAEGNPDVVLITAEAASCAPDTYTVSFAPLVSGVDLGAGHVIQVMKDLAHTAGGNLLSTTTLEPFDSIGTVMATDNGDGVYSVSVSDVTFAPGDTVVLQVRIDAPNATPFTLTSTDLQALFSAEGC